MTPFTIAGTLNLPGDVSLPADPIPFGGSSSATSEANTVLNLVGSGTKSIPLGTIGAPGCIGVLIKLDPNSTPGAPPVNIKVNSSSSGLLEISPGGCIAIFNPSPVAGITALDVIFTGNG